MWQCACCLLFAFLFIFFYYLIFVWKPQTKSHYNIEFILSINGDITLFKRQIKNLLSPSNEKDTLRQAFVWSLFSNNFLLPSSLYEYLEKWKKYFTRKVCNTKDIHYHLNTTNTIKYMLLLPWTLPQLHTFISGHCL